MTFLSLLKLNKTRYDLSITLMTTDNSTTVVIGSHLSLFTYKRYQVTGAILSMTTTALRQVVIVHTQHYNWCMMDVARLAARGILISSTVQLNWPMTSRWPLLFSIHSRHFISMIKSLTCLHVPNRISLVACFRQVVQPCACSVLFRTLRMKHNNNQVCMHVIRFPNIHFYMRTLVVIIFLEQCCSL